MGIRDEAEAIIAREDKHEHDRREGLLTRVRDFVSQGMADWARDMGMKHVPEYAASGPHFTFEGKHDEHARVDVSFREDGLDFEGKAKLGTYSHAEPELHIFLRGVPERVSGIADLAAALRAKARLDQGSRY